MKSFGLCTDQIRSRSGCGLHNDHTTNGLPPGVATETAENGQLLLMYPLADGDYAVFIEQSWLSERAVSEKGPEGFTVTFAVAAPAEAKLDWMLVR